jgi:hypothetical protein
MDRGIIRKAFTTTLVEETRIWQTIFELLTIPHLQSC